MTWSRRIRELLWPSSGWRRSTNYLFHRVARIPGSPHFIAAGFACGAAVSFTPFVGFHFVLSFLVAWIVRGSMLAAALGTAVGNPWTFPFIWIWIYEFGHWMLNIRAQVPADAVNFTHFFAHVTGALLRVDFVYLFHTAWPVFWPMFVGSIPTAVVVWFAIYLPFKPVVATYQHRRRVHRMRKKKASEALDHDSASPSQAGR